MRKRLTAVALAGTVGLGAVGATAVAYPALADNSKKESPQAGSAAAKQAAQDRQTAAIKAALKGLVDDKTLTQAQADKVASTLGDSDALRGGFGGPGGPAGQGGPGALGGGGLLGVEGPKSDEAAAKILGLSVDDLRTQQRSGSTLAEIAKKQGKDVDTLVTALVAVAKEQVDESVKAGRLSQETATQIEKTLEQRVRTVVQNGRPAPAMGAQRWRGGGPGKAPDGQMPKPGPTASTSANSSPSSGGA